MPAAWDHLFAIYGTNGLPVADYGKGSGLTRLTDRVEALAGRIRITSPPGQGTSLYVTIPLHSHRRHAERGVLRVALLLLTNDTQTPSFHRFGDGPLNG